MEKEITTHVVNSKPKVPLLRKWLHLSIKKTVKTGSKKAT
jgi:hypothetical protein